MRIKGKIKKIYFSSANNYAAILIEDENGLQHRAAGTVANPVVGLNIIAEGSMENSKYGEQLHIQNSTVMQDTSAEGMAAYLSSGFIKGIGPKRARLIVDRFGDETEKIIINTPEKLSEIPGITPEKAKGISEMYQENMVYLQIIKLLGDDTTVYQVRTIFEKYGKDSVQKLKENPYVVIYDLDGFGFKKADILAAAMGIKGNDSRRIGAAITYTLKTLATEGHCFCRLDSLEANMRNLIEDIDTEKLADVLTEEIRTGHLVLEEDKIYIRSLWYYENETAKKIAILLNSQKIKKISETHVHTVITQLEKKTGFALEERQKTAIASTANNRMCVITGGPGTGKTTIVQGIIRVWNDEKNTYLVAPTGRAAKRMADVTGMPASTIHRMLLEYKLHPDHFSIGKSIIIADEASMLDIRLAYELLRFVVDMNASLVLIGDIYQLPPIGPGNFFRDIVQSPCVPTITLELSYRQSGKIAVNAKKINTGHSLNSFIYDDTFQFISASKEKAQEEVIKAYKILLEKYKPEEICCITPIRKDTKNKKRLTSSNALNVVLRDIANPITSQTKTLPGSFFRTGDRVMQTVNNTGKWVMNGDCGTICKANEDDNCFLVAMDDGRMVEYTPTETTQLVLAYATTVHKAQGSEYEAVILLQNLEHYKMLQRTLLYTGVTRAKKQVILIGEEKAINIAVRTIPDTTRNNSSETDGHGNPQKNSTDASFESSEKDLHDKDDSEKIDPLEFELSEKDVRLLLDEIALCKVDAESENLENDKTNQVDNSSDEICKKYPSATCYNTTLSADLSGCDNDYQAIIEEIQGGITHLAKQFERMFRNNRGDTVYRESGRISPKRLIRGTKTSRVFTKRIDPKNKGNIAVELVVDVSGSMSCGNRMSVARKAVIGLAEVFEKVHIPCKVLAFTADKKGYTAYHYHILNWHNNRASRKQLLLLHPQNNNFDGFSIRCAGAEIAKRPEQHKLIIVISDGQPICHSYSSVSNGVADTTRAIQEASKNATVIGVAIAADIDVLHSMYGRNFVYVEHIDDMFDQIGQVIKKEVASW